MRDPILRCLACWGRFLNSWEDIAGLEKGANRLHISTEPQLTIISWERQHLVTSNVEVTVILADALAEGGNQERAITFWVNLSWDLYFWRDLSAWMSSLKVQGLQRRTVQLQRRTPAVHATCLLRGIVLTESSISAGAWCEGSSCSRQPISTFESLLGREVVQLLQFTEHHAQQSAFTKHAATKRTQSDSAMSVRSMWRYAALLWNFW